MISVESEDLKYISDTTAGLNHNRNTALLHKATTLIATAGGLEAMPRQIHALLMRFFALWPCVCHSWCRLECLCESRFKLLSQNKAATVFFQLMYCSESYAFCAHEHILTWDYSQKASSNLNWSFRKSSNNEMKKGHQKAVFLFIQQ